jgi:ketosteroid isomerase-like protein
MSSESDPILEAHRSFVVGMKSGDISKLVVSLDDAIVFMPPADGTISGKSGVQDWYEDYFKFFSVLTLDITDRSVSRIGDCIVERIAVNVSIEPRHGGTAIYDDARILSIWRRHADGSWKMWQSMWNSVKPIGAGTNRFLVRSMRRED